MVVQDDSRESELIDLFELTRPTDASRGGVDAVLDLDDQEIPFELKSTTRGSVTTVRDFSPAHVEKWSGKHWLIGFYDKTGETLRYSVYGSPQMMAAWIEEKASYVASDYMLAEVAPDRVTSKMLHEILGKKSSYTLEDAQRIQKKQYRLSEYKQLMDVSNGYSKERMLQILKERCRYLIQRGATLNNPHIPARYFRGWERITENHAQRLRQLLLQALGEG